MAANTPMLLKAGLVRGDPAAGVLSAGQAVGLIEDLPSCEELVDRIIADAVAALAGASATVVG
jgi:NAD(P)H-dependent flavin oxidoreductase YrpB (nitropropane dioxygenase family)